MTAARLNALRAVELDPVRRRERLLDVRLAAAVVLAPRVETCEVLLLGLPVPADRLAPVWVAALGLAGAVVLDGALAFRVLGHGPIGGDTR